MEHQPIQPAVSAHLTPDMADTLAMHGLRELMFAPIPKVARALAGFDRDQLGIAIEIMIAMLDAADPDPEAEADDRGGEAVAMVADPDAPPEDGDVDTDLEQTFDEDDWMNHGGTDAGCPISDPGGGAADDEGEPDQEDGDPSWTEWHTRGSNKLHDGVTGMDGNIFTEDVEEDDDSGQCTEDEISCGSPSHGRSGPGCVISDPDAAVDDSGCDDINDDREEEEALTPDYGIDQTKSLPDAMVASSDRAAMKPHKERIRRERCDRLDRRDIMGRQYHLRQGAGRTADGGSSHHDETPGAPV